MKFIKEITGHVSNAVEKYEITSDAQCMELSSIIQGQEMSESDVKIDSNVTELEVNMVSNHVQVNVDKNLGQSEHENAITNAIQSAVNATGNRKAHVTIMIDFEN